MSEPRRPAWWDRFRCERLGWHKPGNARWVNPASFSGTECYCIRCKRRLLMDSQRNPHPEGRRMKITLPMDIVRILREKGIKTRVEIEEVVIDALVVYLDL